VSSEISTRCHQIRTRGAVGKILAHDIVLLGQLVRIWQWLSNLREHMQYVQPTMQQTGPYWSCGAALTFSSLAAVLRSMSAPLLGASSVTSVTCSSPSKLARLAVRSASTGIIRSFGLAGPAGDAVGSRGHLSTLRLRDQLTVGTQITVDRRGESYPSPCANPPEKVGLHANLPAAARANQAADVVVAATTANSAGDVVMW
jgi:hypothetical protein